MARALGGSCIDRGTVVARTLGGSCNDRGTVVTHSGWFLY